MRSHPVGTIFKASIVKPVLFCTGAMAVGVALAIMQGWWRLLTSEDVCVDIEDDYDLPSLLPNIRGVA